MTKYSKECLLFTSRTRAYTIKYDAKEIKQKKKKDRQSKSVQTIFTVDLTRIAKQSIGAMSFTVVRAYRGATIESRARRASRAPTAAVSAIPIE